MVVHLMWITAQIPVVSLRIIFRFGGALIAYNNIRIQQAMGLIVDPYIHFDIVADFIVFK